MDTESQIYEEERQRRLKGSAGVRIVIEINKQGNLILSWNIDGQENMTYIPLRSLISMWYYKMRQELPDHDESWTPTEDEVIKLLNQEHDAPYYDNP